MRVYGVILALLISPSAAYASAAEAFAKLQSLVGAWEGKFSNGRTHRVTYRMTAGDTVLVETWSLAPGRESMTMYHLDGDALIATHYCPAGNQPTLELSQSDGSGWVFDFRSATNLAKPAASHQHRFEIRLHGPQHFWRSETYLENGEKSTEAVEYTRIEAAGAYAERGVQCGDVQCAIASEYCVKEHFAAAQPTRYSCRKLPLPKCGNLADAGVCSGDAKNGFVLEINYP